MITKQCQFAGRDTNGEYIHLLRAGYDNAGLVKEASNVAAPPQLGIVQRFMKGLPKVNGKLYTLISALGAGEYWSSNSNGDYFGEESLLHTPPGWNQLSHSQQAAVGKRWEWGYPTFYNANLFSHHQNKDPNRAFGSIEYVMWDPLMKRVLLITAFDRARAKQFGSIGVIDRIENGEFASVSMGCRVPFDTCSVCFDFPKYQHLMGRPAQLVAMHKQKPIQGLSTETNNYCYHLKNELNKIYPDGSKVMMKNMHPRFFDLSVVFVGADKTSFVLAKLADERTDCVSSAHVAEVWDRSKVAMEKTAQGLEDFEWEDPKTETRINDYLKKKRRTVGRIKTSALDKRSEIIKQIQSNFRRNLPTLQREEPDIPRDLQDALSSRLSDGLSTAGSLGIVAKPREFQRMYVRALGRPGLADELDDKRFMFRTGASPADDFRLSSDIVPKILSALLPLMGRRSALTPSLGRRTTVIIKCRPRPDIEEERGYAELDHPMMDKVSSAYSAYRRDLLYKSAGLIKQAAFTYPKIHHALHGDQVLEGGLVKEGADVMESIVGMLTSTYLNEAYLNEPVSEFVGSNCNLAGLEKASGLAILGGVA